MATNGMTAAAGPYLAAAFFCEKVLQEKDGVLSAIRIVDRVSLSASTVSLFGTPAPSTLPPDARFPLTLMLLVALKAGTAEGSHTVTIRPIEPAEADMQGASIPIELTGGDGGINLTINLTLNVPLQAEQDRVYWFELLIDDTPLTRVPLRVLYGPTPTEAAPDLGRSVQDETP